MDTANAQEKPTKWMTKAGSFTTSHIATIKCNVPTFTVHRNIDLTFFVTTEHQKGKYKAIIGQTDLRKLGIDLKFSNGTIVWDDIEIPMQKVSLAHEAAYLQQADSSSRLVSASEDRVSKILDADYICKDLITSTPAHLTHSQKEQLLALLKDLHQVFQGTLSKMFGEPYRIPLKEDAKPYSTRPYSIPHVHQKTVKREINRLTSLGVIKKSKSSPWSAPCFIIPKKNGTVRFLTDFRRLNE